MTDQSTPEGRLRVVLDHYKAIPEDKRPSDTKTAEALTPLLEDVLGLKGIKVTVRKPDA